MRSDDEHLQYFADVPMAKLPKRKSQETRREDHDPEGFGIDTSVSLVQPKLASQGDIAWNVITDKDLFFFQEQTHLKQNKIVY